MSVRGRAGTALCLAAWLVAAGCGLDQVRTEAPPSNPPHAPLGALAVVPARFPPRTGLEVFAEGRLDGAVGGMIVGAGLPLLVLGDCWCCFSFVDLVAIASVGAAIGSVWGAVAATPASWADELHAEAEGLLRRSDLSERVAVHVYRALCTTRTRQTTTYLPDAGPASTLEQEDFRVLQERAFDSVVTIAVQEIGFTPVGGQRDPVKVYLLIDVRLRRVADGETLYRESLRFHTRLLELEAWHTGGAELLEEELVPVATALVERVAKDVFWVDVLPSQAAEGAP